MASGPQEYPPTPRPSGAVPPLGREGGKGAYKGNAELLKLAKLLYDIGFNVIPVGADKKPLCKWNPSSRISVDELLKLVPKASGIAIVGGPENPWGDAKHPTALLALIDVDKPSVLEQSPFLKEIAQSTVAWRTGPRCPKCEDKHVEVLERGKRFKCGKCGTVFAVGEAKRGLGLLISLDFEEAKRCGLTGTLRSGDVEILISNYQLIPPSVHPTGVRYEWVKPFDFTSPNFGIYAVNELGIKRLLSELGTKPQPSQPTEGKAAVEKPLALRNLSGKVLARLEELLKPVYEPGNRHLIWLYLSGECARRGVSYLSAAKVLKRLYDETGDTDDIRGRGACIVYSYLKAGVRVDKRALAEILGVEPLGPETLKEEPVKGVDGLLGIYASKYGEDNAQSIVKEIKKLLKPQSRRIPVVWVEEDGKLALRQYVKVRRSGTVWKAVLYRYAGGEEGKSRWLGRIFAIIPDIYELHDTATFNTLYVAKEGEELVAASVDLEGLLKQLAPPRYIVKPTLSDTAVQMLLREVIVRQEGVFTPGLGPDGFADPFGHGYDTGDYGIEGLLAVESWVESHYPEANQTRALANVAFAVAKLAAPAVRVLNPTFIDNPVWNHGRGGEGKSTLVSYAILPLLSVPPNDERCYVAIRGPVETSAQAAFLVASSRMPLVFDEQTLSSLVKNAPVILSASVGQGVFKIHAPKYGLGGKGEAGAIFRSLRSPMIFTNVELEKWLKRVREEASDVGFARRIIGIEWEYEPVNPRAFANLPNPKPIIGAVERVWLKHKEELAKSRDLIELAKKLFALLSEEYNADLSPYIRAVEKVESEWRGRVESLKLSDEDILRERATEIARKELGVTSLTGLKTLLSLLENPDAYGIRTAKPKDSKVAEEESKQLLDLATSLATASGEERQRLAAKLGELAGQQATRAIIKAGGPLIPGTPKQFLGVQKGTYTFGGKTVSGYSIPLSKIIRIFLPEAVEEAAVSGT